MIYDLIQEYWLMAKLRCESRLNKSIPRKWSIGDKGEIVLLPGLNETYISLKCVSNGLNEKGYKIRVIPNYEPNAEIEKNAKLVGEYIKKNRLKKVILMSHSKGGLVARLLLTDKKIEPRIKKVFLIATPNDGSIWCYLPLEGVWQIRPRSKFLQNLNGQEAGLKKIVNILPKVDNHVIPNKSLYLKGAKNVVIDIVGHTRILNDGRTFNATWEDINTKK